MDAFLDRAVNTKITLKADSLIFHDSVIFDGLYGANISLAAYTTDATLRNNDMRYGVINDRGESLEYYKDTYRDVEEREKAGPAIAMADRGLPVVELGYQRTTEPGIAPNPAPNAHSLAGNEATPTVGGDVVVAFKHDFKLPIFNTVVANNARISFITDSFDNIRGGEYIDSYIRTDLLRIRNKVEFYTDPANPRKRTGKFIVSTLAQMSDVMEEPGIFMRHIHTEPGSELSIPGEDSIWLMPTTVLGGYGHVHENVFVKVGGIVAPGFASLMESDCQTPHDQGRLTVHNLTMEQYSILRVSLNSKTMQTDTISVDTLNLRGKIAVLILPETGKVPPGRYLFLEYGDADGASTEYVKNLILLNDYFDSDYFYLDYSESGKVYLKSVGFNPPEVQHSVDLQAIDGVTYNYVKVNGELAINKVGRNYVKGYQDYEMNLTWAGASLKAYATGFYSHAKVDLDATAKRESDGSVTYFIRQVVEPWSISFGPEVDNENIIGSEKVWTYRNTLYINTPVEDVVSIYNVTGVLNKKETIPAGLSKLTLEKGMYVVTLKDGKVYKIVVQ
jgi:hypothetical protein